jgi:hypothetical protein
VAIAVIMASAKLIKLLINTIRSWKVQGFILVPPFSPDVFEFPQGIIVEAEYVASGTRSMVVTNTVAATSDIILLFRSRANNFVIENSI